MILSLNVSSYLKKTLNISFFITLIIIHFWSCADNTKLKKRDLSEIEKDSIIQDYETGSTKKELTKYDKKWVEYVDENGLKLSELELYISEFEDTLCWNIKMYKNGVLDYSKSNFYDFTAKMGKDSTIKGRITLYSELDHSIKGPIVERELSVDFVNQLLDSVDVITFKSKNENYVDFEFKNNNDTIIGLLTEYRRIDLITSPDSTRLIWSKFPIDNKSQTENIFINVHELDKNKR